MHIDCADCAMQHTDACSDCIVTYLLDRPEGAIVFDVAEERAIRALQTGGLIAGTRFVATPHVGSADAGVGG